MKDQVIAAVLGGLVIGGAAFIPMEGAALLAPATSTTDNKVAEENSDAGAPGADESIDDGSDGSAGTASSGGTAPAPITGPTFGSGDDDDDDDDEDDDHEDREDDDDDHEDRDDDDDD